MREDGERLKRDSFNFSFCICSESLVVNSLKTKKEGEEREQSVQDWDSFSLPTVGFRGDSHPNGRRPAIMAT